MICPNCSGSKTIPALLHHSDGSGNWGCIQCSVCQGKGVITPEGLERLKQGNSMRLDRIGRGLSLREEAKRLGISPIVLSHREQGHD